MDLKYLFSSLKVWQLDIDHSVESSRSCQGWVQNVFSICGSENDHIVLGVESIHFAKKLIKSRIGLPASRRWWASLSSNGINFVYEDNCRGFLFGSLKKVSDSTWANPDVNLVEFTSWHVKEIYLRLPSTGSGEKSLSCSRWSGKKSSFWNLRTHFSELFRHFKKIDEFLDFLLNLLDSCHIFKEDLRTRVFSEQFGWRFFHLFESKKVNLFSFSIQVFDLLSEKPDS